MATKRKRSSSKSKKRGSYRVVASAVSKPMSKAQAEKIARSGRAKGVRTKVIPA